MAFSWIERLKAEFKSFTRSQQIFIFCAMACSFLIASEYAIIRPVSNAVFLTAYGTSYFPYAWIASVPLNFIIVALYNKYLPRFGCLKMLSVIACTVTASNLLCSAFLSSVPSLPFLFYVWKEVYIMLMFQQLWSVIHSTISFSKAKYLYGLFFGMGGLGAAFGSILPGFFAVKMGSESLLIATLPIYLLLIICYRLGLKHTPEGIGMRVSDEKEKTSLGAFNHGMKLILSSRYLLFILSIVVLMQLSASLIDYQFNSLLEKEVLDKDLRTEYTGRVFGAIHVVTIGLQLLGSFILIQYLGLKRSHFLIPFLLSLNSIAFLFFPVFGVISFAFITIKSCDFSLFGVIREMLYIPLKPDEKFRAKAVIDVFAHRTSKAVASLLILSLQTLLATHLSLILSWASILLFVLWLSVVVYLFKHTPSEPLQTTNS